MPDPRPTAPSSPAWSPATTGPTSTRIALEIARDADPDLDPRPYLARLDALADRVRPRCPAGAAVEAILQQINWVLFVEEGFARQRGRLLRPPQQLPERGPRPPDRHPDHAWACSTGRSPVGSAWRWRASTCRRTSSCGPSGTTGADLRRPLPRRGPARRGGLPAAARAARGRAVGRSPRRTFRPVLDGRGRRPDAPQPPADLPPVRRRTASALVRSAGSSALEPRDPEHRKGLGLMQHEPRPLRRGDHPPLGLPRAGAPGRGLRADPRLDRGTRGAGDRPESAQARGGSRPIHNR